MVKKMKSSSSTGGTAKSASGLLDSHLAQSVKESAQQIWLAGMGAFSKAQEEGGKVFDALVKEGASLQKKTQGAAEDKISEVTGKMSAMAGTVTAKAGQNWDKLESIFEARTAKAMNKLGVPTAKDVDALVQRVNELTAAVASMSKGGAAKAARASKRPVKSAAKTAAKPAKTAKAPATKAAQVAQAAKAAKPVARPVAKRVAKRAAPKAAA